MTHDDFICGIVYVYRHKQSGEIFAERHTNALALEDDENYEHIATLNAAAWIQRHYNRYDSAKEFGMEVAMKVLETQSWALLKSDDLEQIVDEVMEKNT